MVLAAVVTLVGVALGWLLNEVTRARTTHAEVEGRRSDFQRETLVELQDVINDVTYLAVSMVDERRLKSLEAPGGWSSAAPDEEVQNASKAAHRRAYALVTRVRDDGLREKCGRVVGSAAAAVTAEDVDAAKRAASETADSAFAALDAIGHTLRTIL